LRARARARLFKREKPSLRKEREKKVCRDGDEPIRGGGAELDERALALGCGGRYSRVLKRSVRERAWGEDF
jgi:hypothetical protein